MTWPLRGALWKSPAIKIPTASPAVSPYAPALGAGVFWQTVQLKNLLGCAVDSGSFPCVFLGCQCAAGRVACRMSSNDWKDLFDKVVSMHSS